MAESSRQFVESDGVGRVRFDEVRAGAMRVFVKISEGSEGSGFALDSSCTEPVFRGREFLHAQKFLGKRELGFGVAGFGFVFDIDEAFFAVRRRSGGGWG